MTALTVAEQPAPTVAPASTGTLLAVPPIVAGRVDDGPLDDVLVRIGDTTVVTRYPDRNALLAIESGKREFSSEIRALGLRDVSLYLHQIGSAWLDRIGEIGQTYGELITSANGLNWKVVASDYQGIGAWLISRGDHYQLLRAELGNAHAMDEWHRIESTRQRAVGRGLVFHSLVGNIPLAGLWSLVRGLITRNANLLKLPSRDPLSVHLFARCAIEAAPDHPLTRGISALYWPRTHELAARLPALGDAACLWGSDESIRDVRALLRPSAPSVAFGPRRSCAVVDLTGPDADVDDAARRLAIEASFYDQEACLSPLRAYVLGPHEEFEERLGAALERLSGSLPRRFGGIDAEGHIRLVTEEARVRDWSVNTGDGWATIVCGADEADMIHPLGRTMFLHPCSDLDEIARWLDDDSQTVAVYPYDAVPAVADHVLVAGGSRVVELGLTRHPRRGFAHDGLRVLNSLVRWVSIEDDMVEGSIYGAVSRHDLHRFFTEI